MRCIFCNQPSDDSSSVEHLIPESLGNTKNVLPRGVVCDGCNNYFSRKVEAPFLNHGAVRHLRFHQRIPSKKNRIPSLDAPRQFDGTYDVRRALQDGRPGRVHRQVGASHMGILSTSSAALGEIGSRGGGLVVFPDAIDIPSDIVVSRFLAKCAIEAFAQRLLDAGEDYKPLVDFEGVDELREHARRGRSRGWPFSIRRIYGADRELWDSEFGDWLQTMHEYDLLVTHPERIQPDGSLESEMYFVLALFGLEFAINMGGPEVDGYTDWLRRNNGASPLYTGKNAGSPSVVVP